MPAIRSVFVGAAVFSLPAAVSAQCVRVIDRADYLERLRGLWLGECIAN